MKNNIMKNEELRMKNNIMKNEERKIKNEELRMKNENYTFNEQSKTHSSFGAKRPFFILHSKRSDHWLCRAKGSSFFILHSSFFILLLLLCACSANNCPLESTVTCNYGFYDSEGVAVEYEDTISVRTLLPGMKTVYTYRKLGQRTVVLDKRDSTYIKNGYTETVSETRRDAVLASNVHNASSMKIQMSYYSNFDTLIFDYSSISNKDTVYLTHDSYSNVELPECGTHRFHHLKEIRCTHYGIDRIEIGNPDVNYKGNENVKVYFNGSADY